MILQTGGLVSSPFDQNFQQAGRPKDLFGQQLSRGTDFRGSYSYLLNGQWLATAYFEALRHRRKFDSAMNADDEMQFNLDWSRTDYKTRWGGSALHPSGGFTIWRLGDAGELLLPDDKWKAFVTALAAPVEGEEGIPVEELIHSTWLQFKGAPADDVLLLSAISYAGVAVVYAPIVFDMSKNPAGDSTKSWLRQIRAAMTLKS